MELLYNRHRLEIYPKDMVDKMILNSLENRSTTFSDFRRGHRAMTIPDKRFFLKNKEKKHYIFSSNQQNDIKKFLNNNDIVFTEKIKDDDYKPTPTTISLNDGIKLRDTIQIEYSAFLDQELPSVLCTLQTGKGKTGSTIISLLKRENKNRIAILISPRYHDTWIDALFKFTNIKKNEILVISGRASLQKIQDIDSKIQAVILSPATIREYVKAHLANEELPFPPDKIMHYIGSEDLIIDEVHEDFAGNYLNVLALNPKRYIALTASYSSKSDSDKIKKFKKFFIPLDNRLPEAEFDKYVNIVFCQYRLENPSRVQHKNDVTGWYNHSTYEQSMIDNDRWLEEYFEMIIWFTLQYYDNKNRLLFLFSRVSICLLFKEYLLSHSFFKKKNISVFVAGDKDKENLKSDVIIATNQSGGTGIDIIDLQTTVNTINVGSDYSAIQYSGRNRQMEGTEQYFLSIMSTNISAHMNYMRSNREIYETRAKKLLLNYYNIKNICTLEDE